ncbi:MAG: transglutaminase-like domain-containing protein, partial [Spirochaetia bacterium]
AWARAPDVLSRGTGSCSEYSSVFSAIARSFGIPTRYAFGTLFSADDEEAMTYRDEHFHRWVEVYIPDIGWVPVDTNREDRQNGEYRQNLVFGYDWKVLQHSARFSDDGSFLGTNMMLLHRWSRGRNSAESGDVFRSHWAEWEIMNRY